MHFLAYGVAVWIFCVGVYGAIVSRTLIHLALCLDPLRQIVLSGIYGLLLVILFVVLQAPDVALSMLVVSTVAYPLIVLAAIRRTRK